MKLKAPSKPLAAAREQARALEETAQQLGEAASAAKEGARQAKANLKLAKHEAKQARKAAKDAKRAFAEAERAAEDAAEALAALEKQFPASPAATADKSPDVLRPKSEKKSGKAKPSKPKRSSSKPKRREAPHRPVILRSPGEKGIPAMPVSLLGSMRAHQAETGTHHEPVAQVPSEIVPVPSSAAPGDIAPVPAEVFAGSPAQHDESFALADSDTNK